MLKPNLLLISFVIKQKKGRFLSKLLKFFLHYIIWSLISPLLARPLLIVLSVPENRLFMIYHYLFVAFSNTMQVRSYTKSKLLLNSCILFAQNYYDRSFWKTYIAQEGIDNRRLVQ